MCLNSDDTVFIKILNLIICWEGKAVLFVTYYMYVLLLFTSYSGKYYPPTQI